MEKRTAKFVLAVLIGFSMNNSHAATTDAVKLTFKAGAVPAAEGFEIVLPAELRDLLKTRLPDFRFPGPTDLTSYWNELPRFASIADFNRDQMPDVAVILLGPSNEEWKLIAFSSTKMGYRIDEIFDGKDGGGSAQGWEVGALGDEGQPSCMTLAPLGACGGTWCWNGSKYQQQEE